jgi:hypothetical protein
MRVSVPWLFISITRRVLWRSAWNLTTGIDCSTNRCAQCAASNRAFTTANLVTNSSSGCTANPSTNSCVKRGTAGVGYCRSTYVNRHKNEWSYHDVSPIEGLSLLN